MLCSLFVISKKELFLLISFLIPNLFMFKQINSASAILGYFFSLANIIIAFPRFHRQPRMSLIFALHIFFILVTCVIYLDQKLLLSLIRFALNFSLFSHCAGLFSDSNEIRQVVKMYFAGVIVAILMGMAYCSYNGTLYNGYFAGINCDRNYFGAVIAPAVTIAVLYFLEKKVSFSETILFAATTVLCVISIVLSRSRTTTLSLVFPVLLCFVYLIRSFWHFNKKVFPLILLLFIFVIILYNNFQDSLESLFARFSNKDMATGNHRFELWELYFSQIFESPITFLFGSGSTLEGEYAEHNTIIQSIYQLGIVGAITLLIVLFYAFQKIIGKGKMRFVSFFPLLSVTLLYCGISGLYADQLSYLIILGALIIKDFSIPKTFSIENHNIINSVTARHF